MTVPSKRKRWGARKGKPKPKATARTEKLDTEPVAAPSAFAPGDAVTCPDCWGLPNLGHHGDGSPIVCLRCGGERTIPYEELADHERGPDGRPRVRCPECSGIEDGDECKRCGGERYIPAAELKRGEPRTVPALPPFTLKGEGETGPQATGTDDPAPEVGGREPKTAVPAPSKNGLAAAHLASIRTAHQRVREAERQMERAKSAAKAATDRYNAAISELRTSIEQPPLPFPAPPETGPQATDLGPQGPGTDSAVPEACGPKPDAQAADGGASDDAWRELSIEVLAPFGVRPGILNALREADLTTLGALNDWQSAGHGKRGRTYDEIAGIGGVSRTALEDAFERFWADRAPP